mgnify:CR=1 FL=1
MGKHTWRFATPESTPELPLLHAAQQAVVDWTLGPALVLAGPGTGKTSTLVTAALQRLAEGAPASSILILTFGRDAAAELRERLALHIGSGEPPRVSTFHAFALELVMRVQDDDTALRLLSGAEQERAVRDVIDGTLEDPALRGAWPSDLHEALGTKGFAKEVRNAFAAKLAEKPSQRPLWLVLGTLGIAAAGIGIYVWVQVQAMGGGSLAPVARSSQPQPVAAPPVPPPAVAPPAIALAPAQPNPAPLPGSTASDPLAPAARSAPPRAVPSVFDGAASRSPRPETAGRTANSDAAPGNAVPIRLTRSQPVPDANSQAGYAKLQDNQLDAARHDYELALRADPNNVDTLLALAAIAQRQGRPADASRYQQRAIEADPQNAAAQAALLGAGSGGDQTGHESRLKNLLAAQPESGALNFALGNLYSRQGRWSEAQQLYFNAVAADPDNPDYLFNLAVSLAPLRQAKVAAQHYRLALEAAQRRPPAFDPERVRARLADLGRNS